MKKIAVIAFLTLAAAGWLSRAAALQVYVSAHWDDATTSHLQNGSIVQVILYNSDPDAHSQDPDPSNPLPGDNFQEYSTHYLGNMTNYLANTTREGNLIVYQGQVTVNDGDGSADFGHWVDIPNSELAVYDQIYIRVFEVTEFPEGTDPVQSWWGISELQPIEGSAGTGNAWFNETELTRQDYFEVIPEPSSLALFWLGMGSLGGVAIGRKTRRTRRAPASREHV